MSLYSNITYDHDKIVRLIYTIEALGQRATPLRRPLFNKLKDEVLVLQRAEEKTVYDALEDREHTEDVVHVLEEDHPVIEDLLRQVGQLNDDTGDAWMARFEKLKVTLFDHFEIEETRLLPKVGEVLTEIEVEALAHELKETKRAQWDVGVAVAPVSAVDDFTKRVRCA